MLSSSIELTTEHGALLVQHFWCQDGECLIASNPKVETSPPFVRIHSSCVFSESLGSMDCDCSLQLSRALEKICKEGGYVLYRFEEGRGTGLKNKIEAIRVQQRDGVDTRTAFEALGFQPDPRTYSVAIKALEAIGIGQEVLLNTNNPNKIAALDKAGFVVKRVNLGIERDRRVQAYFDQKKACLGHMDD
ncbi:GTP cyclohydrolase II RibA [Marivita cryptomonadis]|uniref:GTP cyclohydrolase II RibA n=1 Tax=Marivita cryptomonadis TaxID=505252 RepID=A0A9Q2RZV4_9RHOB|nr:MULTISPECIES: GTP cyclohydrolase II RibA [Roseobacteraceae]MBM2173976.1 GTP cyclohydrolase II RibA [Pseudosulfitobacter pseudonitzschiae]MBM2324251.1 GTP cyclohydrolase II RibA [Marivita cryptomonadis]MBM2333843.1 GTP cyclohydrolase II RibA [Marivita cryptomonadis]MBM2343418.1 GTP cyclohydrolase II RibA [Marivita cryptomonadis]MBM2348091.1 GTP cyclohydrolase II RibA [Marivita cryptomonadis]